MSWYKRKPRRHEPVSHTPAKYSSPITDQLMEETRKKVQSPTIKTKNK